MIGKKLNFRMMPNTVTAETAATPVNFFFSFFSPHLI